MFEAVVQIRNFVAGKIGRLPEIIGPLQSPLPEQVGSGMELGKFEFLQGFE